MYIFWTWDIFFGHVNKLKFYENEEPKSGFSAEVKMDSASFRTFRSSTFVLDEFCILGLLGLHVRKEVASLQGQLFSRRSDLFKKLSKCSLDWLGNSRPSKKVTCFSTYKPTGYQWHYLVVFNKQQISKKPKRSKWKHWKRNFQLGAKFVQAISSIV